jgi:vacuolar-type H+-ATPase subunit H
MEMNKILSLGGKLNELIEKTKAEAEAMITDARTEADEIISSSKKESALRLQQAQRRTGLDEFLKDAEKEARIEAEGVLEEYTQRAEKIRSVSESEIKDAAKIVVQEVVQV